MTLDHREARFRHSRRRAGERFNLEIDRTTLASWRRRIVDGADDVVRLSHPGFATPWYAVWHGGEWVPVVYDPGCGDVVTVLPRDVLARHKGRLPW